MSTCQFDVIVLIQEDVFRLDVSVDDGRVSGMQVGHSLQDLLDHLLGRSFVQFGLSVDLGKELSVGSQF